MNDPIEKWKMQLENGSLTKVRLCALAERRIEQEYEREAPPNLRLILALENLLSLLRAPGLLLPNQKESYKLALWRYTARRKKAFRRLSLLLACSLLLLGGTIPVTLQPLSSSPSIQAAMDVLHGRIGALTTANLQEVNVFLGFDLPVSLSAAEGWSPEEYRLTVLPNVINAVVIYRNTQYPALAMSVETRIFVDTENAKYSLEKENVYPVYPLDDPSISI